MYVLEIEKKTYCINVCIKDKVGLHMRHSERGTFNSCPLKYKLEREQLKKNLLGMEAEDRTFGIAVHEALKVYYDEARDLDKAIEMFVSAYPEAKQYKSLAKSQEGGIELLRAYADQWSMADSAWEVIDTEVADKVEFGEDMHELHIDLVARNKQTDEIWLWDHKATEKALSKGFFKKYELDSQVTRYMKWAIDKYGNCGGFYINAMQTGHRQRMYKGEPAGYYQRFDRQPFTRNEQQLKFWENSELGWEKMIAFCKKEDIWPAHLGSLCGWCDFYELCMASGNKNVRDSLYSSEAQTFEVIDES